MQTALCSQLKYWSRKNRVTFHISSLVHQEEKKVYTIKTQRNAKGLCLCQHYKKGEAITKITMT